MRISLFRFTLSLFLFISFSTISYGKEAADCRSYVKSPDWIICLHSGKEDNTDSLAIPKIDTGVTLLDPMESGSENSSGPPDSTFFVEDENGEITDKPRVFNDFSKDAD